MTDEARRTKIIATLGPATDAPGVLSAVIEAVCEVLAGGRLSDRKGINRLGGGLSVPALTDKDREDIRLSAKMEVDYLAVSFVRTAQDINDTRALMRMAGGHCGLVAKIERAEA